MLWNQKEFQTVLEVRETQFTTDRQMGVCFRLNRSSKALIVTFSEIIISVPLVIEF